MLNKIFFITGCTNGLGLELSKILSNKNIIISLSKKKVKHAKFNLNSDFKNLKKLTNVITEFSNNFSKKLDYFIINASVFGQVKKFENLNLEHFYQDYSINFISNIIICKLLINKKILSKKTKIILVSSRMAEYFIQDKFTYSMSKNSLEFFIKYLISIGYDACILRPGAFNSNLRKSFLNKSEQDENLPTSEEIAVKFSKLIINNHFEKNFIYDINGKKIKKTYEVEF